MDGHALCQSVVLGIFFLLLITTYSSFSFIITYIFEQQGSAFKGPLLLATNYAAYLLTLSFTPRILNFKRMFLLAAAAYAINYALEIVAPIATWGVLVSMLGAALGGAAAAILWVSQGGYMKRLLDRYEVPEQFRGRYYGIQNGLIYGNYLLAGLVTTLCLGDPGDVSFYFTVLAGIAMLALLFCCLCLDPLGDARITVDLENRQQESRIDIWKPKSTCKRTGVYCCLMRHMLVPMLMAGFMLGFLSSYITNLIPKEIINKTVVGIFLTIEGLGAILGGLLSGILCDFFTITKVGQSCFATICCNLVLIYACVESQPTTLLLPYLCALVWGFADNYLQGWVIVACAKMYQGSLWSYAITKQLHTLSFLVFQGYMLASQDKINLLLVLLIIFAMAVAASFMLSRYRNEQQTSAHQDQENGIQNQERSKSDEDPLEQK